MDEQEISGSIRELATTQRELIRAIEKGSEKRKGFVERFAVVMTSVSAILVAAIGGIFTYYYNRWQGEREYLTKMYQTRLAEMQAVERFFPTC